LSTPLSVEAGDIGGRNGAVSGMEDLSRSPDEVPAGGRAPLLPEGMSNSPCGAVIPGMTLGLLRGGLFIEGDMKGFAGIGADDGIAPEFGAETPSPGGAALRSPLPTGVLESMPVNGR
jgi:hypothetical protein